MAMPFARHLGAHDKSNHTVLVTDLAYKHGPRVRGSESWVRIADLNGAEAFKACAAVGVNPKNYSTREDRLSAVVAMLESGADWSPKNAAGSMEWCDHDAPYPEPVAADAEPVVAVPEPEPEPVRDMNRDERRADPDAAKLETFAALLRDLAGSTVSPADVENIVRPLLATFKDEVLAEAHRPQVIRIELPERPVIEIENRQHYLFPTVLAYVSTTPRRNVWLYGPAGSGKSTLCENVAHALSLPFYSMSGGPDVSRYDLFGYRDAHGDVVRTPFREAFEFGGLFLFDEIDRNSPEGLTAVNQALANGVCAFPDGMVKRHPDCIFVGGANTIGNGATIDYVGALPIDASSKDRFSFLAMPYDEALETEITHAIAGDPVVADMWLDVVRKHRANLVEANYHDFVISPRASFGGAALLRAGIKISDVIDSELRKGMSDDQWRKVKA